MNTEGSKLTLREILDAKMTRRQFLRFVGLTLVGMYVLSGDVPNIPESHRRFRDTLFIDGIDYALVTASRLLGGGDLIRGFFNVAVKHGDVLEDFLGGDASNEIPAELMEAGDDALSAAICVGGLYYWRSHAALTDKVFQMTTGEIGAAPRFPIDSAVRGFQFTRVGEQPIARLAVSAGEVANLIERRKAVKVANLSLQVGELVIFVQTQEGEIRYVSGWQDSRGDTYYAPLPKDGVEYGIGVRAKEDGSTEIFSYEKDYPHTEVEALTENGMLQAQKDWYAHTLVDLTEPRLFIIEPFSPVQGVERRRKHLLELIALCNAHPDVLHVAAIGTFGSDISDLRAEPEFRDSWPGNLLLTGVIKSRRGIMRDVYYTHGAGADIYIPHTDIIDSSSESTAFITALVHIVLNQNPELSPEELRQRILDLAEQEQGLAEFTVEDGFYLQYVELPDDLDFDPDVLLGKSVHVRILDMERAQGIIDGYSQIK